MLIGCVRRRFRSGCCRFYAHTEANVDELGARLRELATSVQDEMAAPFAGVVLDDEDVARMRRATAENDAPCVFGRLTGTCNQSV